MHSRPRDYWVLALGGAIYGVPVGAILGCVIGAAIVLTTRFSGTTVLGTGIVAIKAGDPPSHRPRDRTNSPSSHRASGTCRYEIASTGRLWTSPPAPPKGANAPNPPSGALGSEAAKSPAAERGRRWPLLKTYGLAPAEAAAEPPPPETRKATIATTTANRSGDSADAWPCPARG